MNRIFTPERLGLHQAWLKNKTTGVPLRLSQAETHQELVEQVDLGNAEFTDCVFKHVTFRKAELCCTFKNCTFSACFFEECNLQDVQVEGCSLESVSLRGCELRGSVVADSRFRHVDLAGVALHKSVISRTLFDQCCFDSSVLRRSYFGDCNMPRCSFVKASAEWATFSDTKLLECNFSEFEFDHTYFARCALYGIHGHPTRVSEAMITDADYSPSGDGSLIVPEERVLLEWSYRGTRTPTA
jgi:uncharacterized protein YjbI with pentapeptide repeats